jgi:N-6 DNA Methylase
LGFSICNAGNSWSLNGGRALTDDLVPTNFRLLHLSNKSIHLWFKMIDVDSAFADIIQLTGQVMNPELSRQAATRFAWHYGWRPSFFLPANLKHREEIASAHLVIEQGLENTAVISFLNKRRFENLSSAQITNLLEISYNNLIDWHIVIDDTRATYLNNRSKKSRVESILFDQKDLDGLRYQRFLQISSDYYELEIETLDEKLLSIISQHRRKLYSLLKRKASVEALSNFFNGIIFCRALEDQKIAEGESFDQNLFEYWLSFSNDQGKKKFRNFFSSFASNIYGKPLPDYILHENELDVFDSLDRLTIAGIFKEYYGNTIYNYDFSLMNKHALGKIYEKYVTQLSIPFESQPMLFDIGIPAEEESARSSGTVYTPQYIASFFTKYAVKEMGEETIIEGKHIDPACGSSVFLRNLAEKITLSIGETIEAKKITILFSNLYAIDINKNATYASILSLSLFYLSLTGKFPENLSIHHADSLEYLSKNEFNGKFTTVFSNPPYINSDSLKGQQKEVAQKVFSDYQKGKFDTYLAFLVCSVNALEEGGLGFFVIPHTFLTNVSASLVREFISENCWVKGIIDLSDVKVFSEVWTYVILLIVQKKSKNIPIPRAKIAKVYTNPGIALEDYLENDFLSTDYVEIYTAPQSSISGSEWTLLSVDDQAVLAKLSSFPTLGSMFEVMQGIATGDDSVFMVEKPIAGEEEIYKPLLPDKSIKKFVLPREPVKYVIYPYQNDKLLPNAYFSQKYPKTWKYLNKFRISLGQRARKSEKNWWSLSTPRQSVNFEQPKIVTPNLILDTKFAVDSTMGFYLTRTTFLYLNLDILDGLSIEKGSEEHIRIMHFYAILMNSPIYLWSINHSARRYAQSYIKIEVNLVKQSRIPDFRAVNKKDFLFLAGLAQRIANGDYLTKPEIEKSERIITKLYGLNQNDIYKVINA